MLMALALAALAALSLAAGTAAISLADVARALVGWSTSDPYVANIIWDVRLPRMLVAMIAGAALATAGMSMQTFFRNPLAGPYVLGVDAGASLGVALATLTAGAGRESFLASVGCGPGWVD